MVTGALDFGFWILEHLVNITADSLFGKGGKGFQRINIATSREILELGLKQIAKAFADN